MRLPYTQWNNYEYQRKYGGGYGWLSYYHYPNCYSDKNHRGSKMAVSSSGNSNGSTVNNMPRIHRKAIRTASKRFPGKSIPSKLHTVTRMGPGKIMKNPGKRLLQRPNPPVCDNSNDSGLGFDNHQDLSGGSSSAAAAYHAQLASSHRTNGTSLNTTSNSACPNVPTMIMAGQQPSMEGGHHSYNSLTSLGHQSAPQHQQQQQQLLMKRRRSGLATKIQMDSDDACSNDAFVFAQQQRHLQQQQILMDIVAAANSTSSSVVSSPGNSSSTSSMSSPTSSSSLSPSLSDDAAVVAGDATTASVNEILATTTSTTTVSPGKSCGVPRSAVRRQVNQVNMQQGGTGLSKNGRYQLQILAQPEQQHRARYQTEGSRGAVKDRSGNSFPIVRLQGYDKPASLEVFIGTDVGRVAPHMFYQACKVSGKNSTPCMEKKVEGTMIIELDLRPEQEMLVTCDCVGILKERNVDVEHRFPDQSSQRSKKKSTRCRMVFRTTITNEDGTTEQLQVCSQPIICTQPPGVPEICKKSLISCPVQGGFELFVIGKNFAKDTKMIFQSQKMTGEVVWQEIVVPDKEYLQQTHLICTIPAYMDKHIRDSVTVQLYAMANGRKSEYHNFVYTPKDDRYSAFPSYSLQSHVAEDLQCLDTKSPPLTASSSPTSLVVPVDPWTSMQQQQQDTVDSGMMPPPNTTLAMSLRRSSSGGILNGLPLSDQLSPSNSNCNLKVEIHDESSQGELPVPLMMATQAEVMAVKQEEMQAVAQQMVQQQQQIHAHNMLMNPNVHLANQQVQVQVPIAVPGPVTPIQFTDQQLTTISQAINATTTNPATSSVMDVGGGVSTGNTIHMDTSSVNSVPQPVNLMVPNCSASDIILNSHNVILGATTGAQGQVVVVSSATSPTGGMVVGAMDHGNISPDVILNPTVTPSLLCETLSGSSAVPVAMPPTSSSAVVEVNPGLLVDPMLTTSTSVNVSDPLGSPQSPNGLATTAEVVQNVQNMILNAAAEILVSQQTVISNESMQAIISLNNAASMLNDQQEQQQQQQHQQNSNILTDSVQQTSGGQVVANPAGLMGVPGDIHMRAVHEEIGHMTGAPVPMNAVTDGLMTTNGIVVNDLMLTNSGPVTSVGQTSVVVSSTDPSLVANGSGVVVESLVPTSSNALIAALNGQTPMMVTNGGVVSGAGVVGCEVKAGGNPVAVAVGQQQPPASIPQEICTMSEHDLISYINPNCFEQEFQNI